MAWHVMSDSYDGDHAPRSLSQHTHVHTHTCTHTCTHTHTYTHTHTRAHACARTHMCVHVHTHTCAHVRTHTNTHRERATVCFFFPWTVLKTDIANIA